MIYALVKTRYCNYRYAAKYVSKSKKQTELVDEVIEYLGKRINDPLPPNMKQTLSHLILADCAHRSFMSKHELSYKVMDLPVVRKTFNDINIVGCYRRANLVQTVDNESFVYSDRTPYSAYAERCNSSTVCQGFEKVIIVIIFITRLITRRMHLICKATIRGRNL